MSMNEIEKENFNKKGSKIISITIKRIKTKFNMKIKWNKMLKDAIEK